MGKSSELVEQLVGGGGGGLWSNRNLVPKFAVLSFS